MISILSVFWMFIIFFGLIGAMRGWAKELLVIFSIVLALFLIYVLESFTPFIIPFDEVLSQVENLNPSTGFEFLPVPIQDELKVQFWSRAAIVGILSFFGYQTPRLAALREKARREKIQDVLLGAVLGLGSGFFTRKWIFYCWNTLVVYVCRTLSIYARNFTATTGHSSGRCCIKCIKVFSASVCQ